MAKGIRSKVKKRFRTAKRIRVDKLVNLPNRRECAAGMQLTALGVPEKKTGGPKNAFLYPNDPKSEIPQTSVKTPIDFRCEAMPMVNTK